MFPSCLKMDKIKKTSNINKFLGRHTKRKYETVIKTLNTEVINWFCTDKVHSITCQCRNKEVETQRYPFSTLALNRGEWSMPRPNQLTPVNSPFNHYTGICVGPGPDREKMKISCPHWGLEHRTVQPVDSRNTEHATLPRWQCGLFHDDVSISEYITLNVRITYDWRVRQCL